MSNHYGSIQSGQSRLNNAYRQHQSQPRRVDSGKENNVRGGNGNVSTNLPISNGNNGNNNPLMQLLNLITQLLQQFQGNTQGNAGPSNTPTANPSNAMGTTTPTPTAPAIPGTATGTTGAGMANGGNTAAVSSTSPGFNPGIIDRPLPAPETPYPQNPGEVVYTKPNTAITIDGLANDTNPATNAIVDFTAPQNGTARIENNKLIYTPNTDFQGFDNFMYMTNDGARSPVEVNVGTGSYLYTQNGKGSAVDDFAQTGNTTPVRIDVLANDFNSAGNLQITSFTQPSNGTVTQDGNALVFTPNKNPPATNGIIAAPNDNTFSYTTNNGGAASVQVYVNYPSANSDYAKTGINSPVSVDVLTNDYNPNNDPFALANTTQATHGSVAINGNNVVYTPDQGFTGSDSFAYQTNQGTRAHVNIEVGLTQSAGLNGYSNQTGNAVGDVGMTPVNTPLTINVLKNDYNTGNAAIKSFDQPFPGSGTVTQNGNALLFTPVQDFQGYTGFSYTREDDSTGYVNLLVGDPKTIPTPTPMPMPLPIFGPAIAPAPLSPIALAPAGTTATNPAIALGQTT